MREETALHHSTTAAKLVDCFSKHLSGNGLSDSEFQETASVIERTSLLFHYTRYRLSLQFCNPHGVSQLYMWTLEPHVYSESILIDGAMIMCDKDMAKADSFLRTKIPSQYTPSPSSQSNRSPSVLAGARRSWLQVGTTRKKGQLSLAKLR